MIKRKHHGAADVRWPWHGTPVRGSDQLAPEDRCRAVREAERTMSRSSAGAGAAFLALLVLFVVAGGYMESHPGWSAGFVATFTLVFAGRAALQCWGAPLHRRHPSRWRRLFTTLALSSATLWSAFCCFAVAVDGINWTTMLVLVCSAAVSAVASATFSPHLGFVRAFHLITLVPMAVLSVTTLGREGLVLGGIVGVSLAFHLYISRIRHREYWQSAINTALLRAREESSALLAAALDHAGEAIEITDAQGRIEHVNPAFEHMTGFSADEARHRNIDSLHPPQDSHPCPPDMVRALGEGRPWTGAFVAVTKDGDKRQHEVTVAPVRDAEGRVTHHVWVRRDVTQTRTLEARLALADRVASLGTLAAGVAHEINNPLASLLLNLDEVGRRLAHLADDDGSEAMRTFISEARDAAERIGATVRELRLFSRADGPSTGPVSLAMVVDAAVRMTRNEVKHRAFLKLDVPDDLPSVHGNDGRLTQVLVHLLINAAQAIDRAEPGDHCICLGARAGTNGKVHLRVRDTGPGFPPEHLDSVFDLFFTTKPVGEGTGLGLSISHSLVTAMGGDIRVSNAEDGGGVVEITLLASEQPAAATDRSSRRVPSPSPEHPLRILVVDDEVRVGRAVGRTLRGHHVTVVGDGRLAVHRWMEGSFDVMLCDLMMPDFTGMDVYRALEARGEQSKIVFMTGGAFSAPFRAFLEQIPNRVLEKPFEPHELRELLQRVADVSGVGTG
jgi:PAS domain S-box-containing protein